MPVRFLGQSRISPREVIALFGVMFYFIRGLHPNSNRKFVDGERPTDAMPISVCMYSADRIPAGIRRPENSQINTRPTPFHLGVACSVIRIQSFRSPKNGRVRL